MVWQSGKSLHNGRYTIDQELGRGRFGITYRAKNQQNQFVVIKTPRDDHPELERLQDVFQKETLKLQKCEHPNVVKVLDIFQESGLCCIVMEYISGTTLADRAQRILPEAEALNYIQQIGSALAEVHRQGLFHRDVCPRNIMLRNREGKTQAVLIDFGLARAFDLDLTAKRTEEIATGFAPPELYVIGRSKGAWTDIYMLGATLYVLLTDRVPVDSLERETDNVILPTVQGQNSHVSDHVNKAIIQAMELESSRRPQSISQWFHSLKLKVLASPNLRHSIFDLSDTWFTNLEKWQKLVAAITALVVALTILVKLGFEIMKYFKAPDASRNAAIEQLEKP